MTITTLTHVSQGTDLNNHSRRDDCFPTMHHTAVEASKMTRESIKLMKEHTALCQKLASGDLCKEGFPVTALRETNALLQLRHPSIIHVRDMVVGSSSDTTYMVMKYAENDLRTLMQKKMKHTFLQYEVKSIVQSLVSAEAFMHANWFIHRDLKTINRSYDKKGVLKVCDFGLAKQ
ncbi:unnamed protein product [Albugo candida]|uniref:Cyclin-dependent kinase 2 homolog n=3 Tax=Albugo candida TaxID=65357 RepID=A0A024GVJ2_9STRA|nr:unnamed protein product [Albugo candida]|eukprot:CCI50653.1 unnamed protein product [Albugo candida]